MLTDTGPLVALLDTDDSGHDKCLRFLRRLGREPLLTTWPCYTEAMYLLGREGGFPYQLALWQWRSEGRVLIHGSSIAEADRMAVLMTQYRDTPMDLADASLAAAAEGLGMASIFTLDRHFYAYRQADGTAFAVSP